MELKLTRYFGKVCVKHPDIKGERLCSNRKCAACQRESVRARQSERGSVAWESHRGCKARYKRSEKGRISNKKTNAVARAFRSKHRASTIKQRTPKWCDQAIIKEIYSDALEFREAGLDVHVDHIIPLKGRRVSGLHVPANLTIKLASFNSQKGNKHESDCHQH